MDDAPRDPGDPGKRRPSLPVLVGAAAVLALGVSCRPVGDARDAQASSEAPRFSGLEAPGPAPWTREGLEEQPRLEALRGPASASLGYEPGATPWEEIAYAPSADDASAPPPASPGAALDRVAESLGWSELLGEGVWEQTTRVWMEGPDQAVGVVLQWGMLDDAVGGRDLRARMMRSDGAWRVGRVERRYLCRRGVSGDGACM